MDEKELQALYNSVSQHLDIGDYNSFKGKMQTPEQRKNFYDAVSNQGFDIGDYDSYEQRVGGVKKKEGGALGSLIGGAVGSSDSVAGVRKVQGEAEKPYDKPITLDENDPLGSLNAQVINKTEKFHNVKGDMEQQKFKPENKIAIGAGRSDNLLPATAGKLMSMAKQQIFPTTQYAQNWLNVHAEKNGGSAASNQNIDPSKYETKLSPQEEQKFQSWLDNNYKQGKIQKGDYQFYKKNGYGYDYDFRAAFESGAKPEINKEDGKWHWNDIGKKPNEPTFSDQSKYNGVDGHFGGTWEGDNFIPPKPKNFPNGIDPNNQTAQLAIEKINDKKQIENSINKFNGDLINASTDYAAATDPEFAKKLKVMGGVLPRDAQGEVMQGFLNSKGVQEWANESQANHNNYMEQKDNFYQNYPNLRVKDIVSKIAQYREDHDFNNPLANFPGAHSSDKVMEALLKEGKVSPMDMDFYGKVVRPAIKVGVVEVPSPGITESALKSTGENIEDLFKGASELSGLHSLVSSSGDDVSREMQEQATAPQVKYSGVNKYSNIVGNFLGVVAPLGLEGKALEGLTSLKGATANRIAMMGTFYHNLYQDNLKDMPESPEKARIAALAQSAVYGWIGNTMPKIAADVVKEATPEIRGLVDKLATGEISGNYAAQKIAETAVEKGLNVAKSLGQAATDNFKMATEMGLAQNINDHIKGMFSGRFDANQATENAVNTFKTMLIGGGPLSLLGAVKNRASNAEHLDEIANNPEPVKDQIKKLSEADPEFANKAPEYLANLNHLQNIHDVLNDRSDLTDKQKKNFQLLSLQQKVLQDKIKESPDKSLAASDEKQVAALDIEKEKLLNPDMNNTTLIQKHFDEDLIPKGFRSVLENEKGKFDENKVGEFLKKVANSEDDKLENVPQPIVEAAQKRWPESKEKSVNLPSNEGEGQNISTEENKGASNSTQPSVEESPEKISQRYKRVSEENDFIDPYDRAVKYFADNGKIHPSEVERIFGGKADKGARISLIKNDGGTVKQIAHHLWETDPSGKYEDTHYIDAVESALRDFPSKTAMQKGLADRYDLQGAYEKYMNQTHGKEAIDIVENMSEDEMNHLLRLESEKNPDTERYIDDLVNRGKLESERQQKLDEAQKPELKMPFIKAEDLVKSNDPVGFKQEHNRIKDQFKKLIHIIDCVWA